MSKAIKSVAQAIGIIGKEVEKMGADEIRGKNKYCIECNAEVTHPGAYFCKPCAITFFDDNIDEICEHDKEENKYDE